MENLKKYFFQAINRKKSVGRWPEKWPLPLVVNFQLNSPDGSTDRAFPRCRNADVFRVCPTEDGGHVVCASSHRRIAPDRSLAGPVGGTVCAVKCWLVLCIDRRLLFGVLIHVVHSLTQQSERCVLERTHFWEMCSHDVCFHFFERAHFWEIILLVFQKEHFSVYY